MRCSNVVSVKQPVFDLYSTQIDADQFPRYRRLRDCFPCYWNERDGIWIRCRYA